MKKKSLVIWIIVVALIAGSAFAYWRFISRETSAEAETAGQILTLEVKSGSVSVRVEGPSVVEPYRAQEIRSRTSGTLLFAAEEGDTVAAGEILVRFDKSDQEAAVRQAELNLTQAGIDLKKAELGLETAQTDLAEKERLLAGGAIARDQVISAKNVLANAELALAGARVKVDQSALLLDKANSELEATAVTAPFDGIVLKAAAGSGDIVNTGSVLLTFADVARVRLKAEVDEYDIGKIAEGMSVSVTSDALPDTTLKSKVERISPAAEVVNNISIFTVSTVLRNDEGTLRPGMSADLSILVSSDTGLIVPSKTVSTVRDRSYIKVYENEEVVSKRITIGANDGINVAVLDGLEEGALVVLPETATLNLSTSVAGSAASIIPVSVPGTGGSK